MWNKMENKSAFAEHTIARQQFINFDGTKTIKASQHTYTNYVGSAGNWAMALNKQDNGLVDNIKLNRRKLHVFSR